MRAKTLARCALFAALTALGAFIRIPIGELVYTMQFLFAALAGLVLGARHGALSQGVYVAMGLCGLPVFGAGGGVMYLLQPTCGFVLALPAAAWVAGRLRAHAVPACLAALATVYAAGLLYMAAVFALYLGRETAIRALAAAYVLPYLPGDAVKVMACAALYRRLRNGKILEKIL